MINCNMGDDSVITTCNHDFTKTNINWYPDNYHGDTFGLDGVRYIEGSSLIGPDETYLCSYKINNEGSFGKILNGDWFKLPSSIKNSEDAKDYVEFALMKHIQNIIVK